MSDIETRTTPGTADAEGPARRLSGLSRRRQRQVVRAIAAISAIAAAFVGCSPTGTAIVDPVLTAAFAALITLAASRSKRWPLFGPVVVAVALARSLVAVPALAAAVTVLIGASRRRRERVWGAATGALAVQALLRLPEAGFHGATALFAAVAVAPVLVSGYRTSRRHDRRRIRHAALAVAGVVVVIGAVYGAVLLTVAITFTDAVASSQAGLEATRSADTSVAEAQFLAAERDFTTADARLNAWWTRPILAIPVAAQHARALGQAADDGRTLAAAARDTVETADYDTIRYQSGQFDLDRIVATRAPLDRTRTAIAGALSGAEASDSPWLVAPLGDRFDRFRDELTEARDEADLAVDALAVAPDLLGANGPRRYFVAFVTPVELRGSGGFMGSYGELTATEGRLRLTRSGPVRELRAAVPPGGARIDGPADYLTRYGRFDPGLNIQDFTFSPHFPFDAEVMQQIYPQAGGQPIDGVISIDPIGLAELLRLTGPIEVEGFGRSLDADNAAEFLLRENYALFPKDATQNDALAELTRTTFEDLTTGDLPGPKRLSDVLSGVTRGGHIRIWSDRAAEQDLFTRVGATGALPPPRPDRDMLAVASQNAGNNKIDYYQRRTIDYAVEVEGDGSLRATATVTVFNDAPTSGVTDYVIGDSGGAPPGTNRMFLSIYTPHELDAATLDGEPTGVEPLREAGYNVFTKGLLIPPGGSATLEIDLLGHLGGEEPHRLDVVPQPTVTPDELRLTHTGADGPLERDPVTLEQPRSFVLGRRR